MTKRIVDVFLQDRLVAAYPIVIALDRPVVDDDFVEHAKARMRGGTYPEDEIARARFIVRSVLDRT
ncbi:MAG: hypothetical protein U1E60_24375 [Reyranellaceae bacterium]